MKDLNCDISMMRQSLSQFGYHCPVTFRNEKKYFKCNFDFENCVLYNHQFYYFKSQTERDIFLEYPKTFIEGIIFSSTKGLPFRIQQHKAAEIFAQEKSQQGYCPVTLMDEERLVRGDQMLIISYRENKFTFASEFKLQKFFQQPQRYHKVNLPVKMPPNDDKVGLFSLHKLDDSITFMEQALGTIVTQGLREVGDNRIKYPTLSCKETMLKLFALYLKFANPANTEHKKKKAHD
jgi:adenylate/nucleoside-diphosphate kinase